MVLVLKGVVLVWDKHTPRSLVAVNTLLNGFVYNTDPQWVNLCCHVSVPPLLHIPLLEEWVIILRNWTIFVGHGLGDLLKVPT